MLTKRNQVAVVLSIVAGALLIISGSRSTAGIYGIILDKLTLVTQDPLILSAASIITLILIILTALGGFLVLLGGYLIYKNHVSTGKLLIGLGGGVGIPWLLLMIVMSSLIGGVTSIIAEHSVLGWAGVVLAIIARAVAKKS